MKLHKDGTVEGTPQEIAENNGLAVSGGGESERCRLINRLHELNKRACAATSSTEHDEIIREANEIRSRLKTPEEESAIKGVLKGIGNPYAGALKHTHSLAGVKVTSNEWGEVVPVQEKVAPTTKWLSEELEKRTGVEVHKIAPHDEYSLIIGHVRHDRTGPATILINID